MRVLELWRYPVKSLQGQRLDAVDVGPQGLAGDRQRALFDPATGFGLTARRVPDLLFAAGRVRGDGGAEVVLPDGTVTADTLPAGQRRRSLAVEPMTCPPNALADGADLVVLAPEGTWSGTWTLAWTPA